MNLMKRYTFAVMKRYTFAVKMRDGLAVKMRCAFLAAAALTAVAAPAQQTRVLTADKHNEYGLVYTLPKTALEISVDARRTVRTPGKYARYAKQYMGIDKVVNEATSDWEITDVRVSTYGVPDRTAQYLMQLKPGATTFMAVGESGMIYAINAEPEGEGRAESRPSGLSGGAEADVNEYLKYVDSEFLSSQSESKQARMLAEAILGIREVKHDLIAGEADPMPGDARQLQTMLEELTRREDAMTRAFTGVSYEQTAATTATYVPDKEGTFTLLRISDYDGFTASDDYAGEPLDITVEVVERPSLPKDDKGVEKALPKDAVVYKIPGTARIGLSFGGRTLYERELEMGQYGVVFGLNPNLFTDKKSPSYVIFDTATGGVSRIGKTSDLE